MFYSISFLRERNTVKHAPSYDLHAKKNQRFIMNIMYNILTQNLHKLFKYTTDQKAFGRKSNDY